jgi:hypothetical protein
MSHVMRPVGPEDPSVYWRRRLAVLVAVVALVVVVYLVLRLTTGGGQSNPTGDAGTAGSTSTSTHAADGPQAGAEAETTPTAGATSGGVAACDAASLQVTATADATTYASGSQPKVGMRIKNIGPAACTLDAGSAALELKIVSGNDRIWSSDDCQQEASSNVQTVEPGGELASSVVWPLQRSAEGCPSGLSAPKPGTYQLTGRVGEITSEPLAFTIT